MSVPRISSAVIELFEAASVVVEVCLQVGVGPWMALESRSEPSSALSYKGRAPCLEVVDERGEIIPNPVAQLLRVAEILAQATNLLLPGVADS